MYTFPFATNQDVAAATPRPLGSSVSVLSITYAEGQNENDRQTSLRTLSLCQIAMPNLLFGFGTSPTRYRVIVK